MSKSTLFSEKQKFTQWWVWLLLLTICAVFFIGSYNQLINNQSFGNNPLSNNALIFVDVFLLLIVLFFVLIRLDTQITNTGIKIRFFPFQLKYKTIEWFEIEKIYIKTYSAIADYGGWGYRFISLNNKGKAYNVSGNIGLQVIFKNGSKILIGTKKPDEIKSVLQGLNQYLVN